MEPKKKNGVIWGAVDETTDRNEIIIALDLATRLSAAEDPLSFKQKQLRLLWYVAYMHELAHAIVKHMFPHLTTPLLAGESLDNDGPGIGESGHIFEQLYLGFTLLAEWSKEEVNQVNRMDCILRLLVKTERRVYYELGEPFPLVPGSNTDSKQILDEAKIDTILGSIASDMAFKACHMLPMSDFDSSTPYQSTHAQPDLIGRYRTGNGEEDEDGDEDEQDDTESPDHAATVGNGALGARTGGEDFVGCQLVIDMNR